ncbi:MAG: hypothetical protein ACOX3U_05615 [Christensenellales bacterium]|jgi:hypothetical protein
MKTPINKKTIIAISVFALLTIAFIVLLILFINNNEQNRDIYENEIIRIKAGESVIGEYNLNELLEYCPAVEFNAVYKPSGRTPIQRTYTGIYLKDLLANMGIDLSLYETAQFTASDGMVKMYQISDITAEDNVFIAYLVQGKPFNKGIDALAYNKPEEDGGPFVVIKALDSVSQNRVKMLVEIALS